MIALMFIWAYRKDARVSKSVSTSFKQFAEQNGFTHLEKEEIGALGLPADLWFLSQGDPCDAENLMTWSKNGVEISVFSFFYIHKHTDKRSWGESILCLRKEGAKIPWFRSFPKKRREDSWWHKGWDRIGKEEPDTFFAENIVKSKEKESVEFLFKSGILEYVRPFAGMSLEGRGDHLIIVPHVVFEPGPDLLEIAWRAEELMKEFTRTAYWQHGGLPLEGRY